MSIQAKRQRILERHAAALMEHFESVQIVAVAADRGDRTVTMHSRGMGSYYERMGAVRHWLQREETHNSGVMLEPEDGDDDIEDSNGEVAR